MPLFLSPTFFFQIFLSIALFIVPSFSAAKEFTIGVFYYPGWSPYVKGTHEPDPWRAIMLYPDRQPLLGWYHDGQSDTVSRQLNWMADFGIDFVTFDWYWENAKPAPETSVRAYLQSPERTRVRYALLWANHNKEPRSTGEWDALVDYWIGRHLKNPEYMRVDGKPMITVFSGDVLRDQAKLMGMTVSEMLNRARARAMEAGLPGIYFVLCAPATDYWVLEFAPKAGFDALTGYNYHFGIAGDANKRTADSHSFQELDKDYRMQWQWILRNSKLPYFIPMTAGWDKRPWGGSRPDPLHDNSMSSPESFEIHLAIAREMLNKFRIKTQGIGMICCWNEYGEGSFVEPTISQGFEYLQRIKKVFGARN